MVGLPGSLYLTGIEPDSSSLMLVAKKTFFWHISLSLLGAHVLKKLSIGRNLLDGIKKWHIYLHLVKHLDYLVHVRILLVVFQPIRKWYYRLMHLAG